MKEEARGYPKGLRRKQPFHSSSDAKRQSSGWTMGEVKLRGENKTIVRSWSVKLRKRGPRIEGWGVKQRCLGSEPAHAACLAARVSVPQTCNRKRSCILPKRRD